MKAKLFLSFLSNQTKTWKKKRIITCEEPGPKTIEMPVGETTATTSFGEEKRMEPVSGARRPERVAREGRLENHRFDRNSFDSSE